MKIKWILLLSALVLLVNTVTAQDFSNKGTDFWVGYGNHVSMYGTGTSGNSQNMVLYFTSEVTCNVKVEIPATGWVRNYVVNPNTVTESDIIPKTGTDDARLNSEGVSNKGIHITSDKPIVAYSHIYDGSVSGASLLFPTPTLGQDYYTLGFTQTSNANNAYSFCFVIATEDNTLVEVTPAAATLSHAAGAAFTQLLQKGQILNLLGKLNGGSSINFLGADLTGTRIRSISNGTSACKRIAVYCGSGKINIKCNNANTATGSADNVIQQCFPANAWGKKYITVPTKDMPNNFFRVMVNNAATQVKLNGTVLTGLINSRYYEFQSNVPNIIESDNPVMLAQYITTANQCGNTTLGTLSDPEMIYLSPVEQTINRITLNSTTHAAINPNNHYLNIIIKSGGISSFKLDGSGLAGSFTTLPGDATYSYAQIKTSAGIHNLQADSGFNAIAYGYGNAESYGYNAGTNVKDLYQFVALKNEFATVDDPATCKNTPFFFSVTLPYKPISLAWDFGNNANLSPNTAVSDANPKEDTIIQKDGKSLYVYKLKTNYTFNATGVYPVKVIANNQTSDGCSGIQEITFDVNVYDPPKTDFTLTQTGCSGDSSFFFDATDGLGRAVTKWKWDFGDGTIDSVKNPVKKFTAPNTYNVKLVSYTELGCVNQVIKPVTITQKPLAQFTVSSPTCAGSTITFTDASTVATGTIVKWTWNFGNGNTVTNSDNRQVIQTYNTAGLYTVSLLVETSTGCKSILFTKDITVNVLPAPDFSFTPTCLPAPTQFTNLSSINDQSSLSYVWNFGDNGSSINKDPSHQYNTGGPFSVKLIATSSNGCTAEKTINVTNIYPQPKAAFSVNPQYCFGDTSFFIDQSTAPGNTVVKWYWNFDDGTIETVQNPVHVFIAAKSYNVKMAIATDKGCVSDTATTIVTVNPKPVADFTSSVPSCETKAVTITDKSTNATLVSWSWDFGDATNATYTNSNPFTKTYNSTGAYNIKLSVVSDKGCKSDTTKPITINRQPQPGFILPEVCLNDAFAQFTDTSSIADGTASGFTYLWNFGDANANPANPNTSTVKDAKHKYTATGIYNVTLTVQSNNGCSASVTKPFTVNGAIPLANFNVLNSNKLCSNTSVQIQNTSTVDFGSVTKLEIIWDFAGAPTQVVTDDDPIPNKIYTYSYPNSQTNKNYQVKVRAYSGGSCYNEKTITVLVNASPKVSFSTIPGICMDASARQITQAIETGSVPGSGTYTGTGINSVGVFNPALSGLGTFPVQYLYISNAGCRDSATQSITTWKSPDAYWKYSSPVCETNAVSFTDSSIANFNKVAKWNWNFGDGTTDNRTSAAVFNKAFAKAGTYNVALQVITDSGCISQPASKSVVVHPLPVVDFSLPAACIGSGAQFNDLSTIADGTQSQFTYLWNFGDPNNTSTASLKSPLHTFTSAGPFNIQLTVTSADGCSASNTKQLTSIYDLPKAGFTIAPPEVCLGTTLIFTDASQGVSGTVTNWSWKLGDGTVATTQNTSRNYAAAGTYNVSLTVTNDKGCVSLPTVKPVAVEPYPTVNAGPDLVVLEGGSLVLSPVVTGSNLSYLWTPSTYLTNDAIKNPVTYPKADITYKLTVTGKGGCTASDMVFVKLLKEPTIPNAFSPNNDGINDTWNIQYLNSYPGATVEIFNRYGQVVFRSFGYINAWDGKMNGSPLPVGVYYYIINPKNGLKQFSGSVTILR